MAELKDTLITGNLRVTGNIYANSTNVGNNNYISHNNFYRGEELLSDSHFGTGAAGLTAIHNAVVSGDFSDIYIGDTITVTMAAISGYESTAQTVEWVVMGINLYYPLKYFVTTDGVVAKQSLTLVPKNAFNTPNVMNDTNITTAGYNNSKMRQTILPAYASAVKTSLGNYLLQIAHLESTAATSERIGGGTGTWGASNSSSFCSSPFLILLNEVEIFGTKIASSTLYDIGFPSTQLPGFRLNPGLIGKKINGTVGSWWTCGIFDTNKFVAVESYNSSYYKDLPIPNGQDANVSCGIVPKVYFT